MTTEVLAFGFGCILIFIAVIGGGMEIRELKVPRVGRCTRLVAFISGVVFIGLAVGFPTTAPETTSPDRSTSPVKDNESESPPPVQETTTPEKPTPPVKQEEPARLPAMRKTPDMESIAPALPPVTFTVVDQLGPMQIRENVQIYINGQLAANLLVDQQQTIAFATIRVPRPGMYAYRLAADGVFVNLYGERFRHQGWGQGTIEVSEGCVFCCLLTPGGISLVAIDEDGSDDSGYFDFPEDPFDDW